MRQRHLLIPTSMTKIFRQAFYVCLIGVQASLPLMCSESGTNTQNPGQKICLFGTHEVAVLIRKNLIKKGYSVMGPEDLGSRAGSTSITSIDDAKQLLEKMTKLGPDLIMLVNAKRFVWKPSLVRELTVNIFESS